VEIKHIIKDFREKAEELYDSRLKNIIPGAPGLIRERLRNRLIGGARPHPTISGAKYNERRSSNIHNTDTGRD